VSTQHSISRHGTITTSLRPIGTPRGLMVRVDAYGHPAAITRADARGHRGNEARIEQIEEIWRIAEAWWREAAQIRTYYRVILEGGRPLTLFRDDASRAWFEQPYSAATHEPPR
jgi:hypothetical protein